MSDQTQTQTQTQQTQQTQQQQTSTTQTPVWSDGLGDELKGYVTTKGFKEPKDVVESYRNLEKAIGVPKERLLQLPESLEDASMSTIWERLGAVKEAKELTIDVPKEYGDEKLGEWFKETFHKLKVPRQMAEGFAKAFNDRQKSMLDEVTNTTKHEVSQQYADLKKEWGNAFDTNRNIANAAANRFELKEDDIKALGAAMGPAKALKFLHKLGAGLGESAFINGDTTGEGRSTPDQAKAEIKKLMVDTDFVRRLSAKDVDAVNKWNRLHIEASPGQISI